MSILSTPTKANVILIFVGAVLLSSCATDDGMTSCIAAKPLSQQFTEKYGNADVNAVLVGIGRDITDENYEAAYKRADEGLALPNINAAARSHIHLLKGNAYFAARDNDKGAAEYEAAIQGGGLDFGTADNLKRQLAHLDEFGSTDEENYDAAPLVRIPPMFPPTATQSGHCRVVLDVSAQGQPENIRTTYCTEDVFKSATITSVGKWRYTPKMVNAIPVPRKNVLVKVSFRLADECGNIIPEPQ